MSLDLKPCKNPNSDCYTIAQNLLIKDSGAMPTMIQRRFAQPLWDFGCGHPRKDLKWSAPGLYTVGLI